MTPALADKVVVIMGGTSGLGLAATKACLRAGARVVAVGLPGQDAVLLEDTLLESNCVIATGDAREPATAIRQSKPRWKNSAASTRSTTSPAAAAARTATARSTSSLTTAGSSRST